MLKASAASPTVALKALEVQIVEEAPQTAEEQPSTFSENEYDASWSPSWVMWLGLPRYYSGFVVSGNNRQCHLP